MALPSLPAHFPRRGRLGVGKSFTQIRQAFFPGGGGFFAPVLGSVIHFVKIQ